jgi:hypothetical protein
VFNRPSSFKDSRANQARILPRSTSLSRLRTFLHLERLFVLC